MKRMITGLLLTAVTLVWTSVAEAKELSLFKACGASGCKETRDPALLRSLIRSIELQGEPVTTRTPVPAPFFRLEFTAKGDEGSTPSLTQFFMRSPARLAIETNPAAWTWVKAGSLAPLLERVTKGVTPFAAPKIIRVEVGGKPVRDPASYARLFAVNNLTTDYPDNGDWITVRMRTSQPTPWSTGAATLEYSPSTDVLWRGAEFLKVPSNLASNLEARASLNRPAADSFPWLAVAGGLGGMAVVVPAALVLRRRRTDSD